MSFRRSLIRRNIIKALPKRRDLLNRLTRVAMHVSIKTAAGIIGALQDAGGGNSGKKNHARP